MGRLANQRHERFAQALAQGKSASEAYVLAGYKANDGNASRLKGNERISARVQEIVGRAAERAEVSLERVLRELAAIAFSDIRKMVTWRNEVVAERVFEEGEKAEKGENCGEGVKALMPRVTLVPAEEIDEATAGAIAQISQGVNGSLRVRLHDKHAALVSIGKHLGMFTDQVQVRAQYGISDKPMSAEEWKKQHVKEG
jgi:phage terminase small subunit